MKAAMEPECEQSLQTAPVTPTYTPARCRQQLFSPTMVTSNWQDPRLPRGKVTPSCNSRPTPKLHFTVKTKTPAPRVRPRLLTVQGHQSQLLLTLWEPAGTLVTTESLLLWMRSVASFKGYDYRAFWKQETVRLFKVTEKSEESGQDFQTCFTISLLSWLHQYFS